MTTGNHITPHNLFKSFRLNHLPLHTIKDDLMVLLRMKADIKCMKMIGNLKNHLP